MEEICRQFRLALGAGEVDPLILIPVFIHDFLCIHPFSDGNGRMSRMLKTLLLYQNWYMVGQYLSLVATIPNNKEMYYYDLAAAAHGRRTGQRDSEP